MRLLAICAHDFDREQIHKGVEAELLSSSMQSDAQHEYKRNHLQERSLEPEFRVRLEHAYGAVLIMSSTEP